MCNKLLSTIDAIALEMDRLCQSRRQRPNCALPATHSAALHRVRQTRRPHYLLMQHV